jgi:DNA-binding MarR family transcriptional regulator
MALSPAAPPPAPKPLPPPLERRQAQALDGINHARDRANLDAWARWAIGGRIIQAALDKCRLIAYTFSMSAEAHKLVASPCLCNALRQASRAVSRLYDDELRGVGLRTTQYSLLRYLQRFGGVRQRDLGASTSLDETTLTRNLRPLIDAGWVTIATGENRREKLVRLTDAGVVKLAKARPAWERAQERLRVRLPKTDWSSLLVLLPELARLADEA